MTTNPQHTHQKGALGRKACPICDEIIQPASDDTRTIRLGGREITQRWDGICWMTVSDRKAK